MAVMCAGALSLIKPVGTTATMAVQTHQSNLTNRALYRVLQARRKRKPIVEQLE